MTGEAEVIDIPHEQTNGQAPTEPDPTPKEAYANLKIAADNFVGAPGVQPNLDTHAKLQRSLAVIARLISESL